MGLASEALVKSDERLWLVDDALGSPFGVFDLLNHLVSALVDVMRRVLFVADLDSTISIDDHVQLVAMREQFGRSEICDRVRMASDFAIREFFAFKRLSLFWDARDRLNDHVALDVNCALQKLVLPS